MKKFLFFGLSIALLGAFNIKSGKNYVCESEGISFEDKNQTRNIPNTPETQALLKQTLKDFYTINLAKDQNGTITVKVGKIEEKMSYQKKWRGYEQYVNADSSAVLMPDKNESTNNVVLVLPQDRLMIFYKCK